jgi:hypothetical protein
MPDITYTKELPLAADAVYRAISDVLERFAVSSRNGEFALSGSAGPTAEKVSIPVEIALGDRTPAEHSTGLTIAARSKKALFPSFTGTVQTAPVSAALTSVRLTGTYSVPFGALGSTINAVALHTVAEAGLRQFLERLTSETMNAVREESSRAYRASRQGP